MTDKTVSKVQAKRLEVVQRTKSESHWAVSKYLQEVKFSPRLMGVDEADVWRKIEKLCELYENMLTEARGAAEARTKPVTEDLTDG